MLVRVVDVTVLVVEVSVCVVVVVEDCAAPKEQQQKMLLSRKTSRQVKRMPPRISFVIVGCFLFFLSFFF